MSLAKNKTQEVIRMKQKKELLECPQCHALNPLLSKFCNQCTYPLTAHDITEPQRPTDTPLFRQRTPDLGTSTTVSTTPDPNKVRLNIVTPTQVTSEIIDLKSIKYDCDFCHQP